MYCTHLMLALTRKRLFAKSVIYCILTRHSMAGWIILAHSSVVRYTKTTVPLPAVCVSLIPAPSNWRLGIDVNKYKQNGLVWNAQSHKCQFYIQQCLPNTHTFPQQCVQKRTCVFSYTGREIAWLASWHTKSPTSHTKISLWSGNYRSSHLTPSPPLPLSPGLPDLLIADWGRQAAQEPFNLALNRAKAENVFSSLRFMTHEQCRMVGKSYW